MDGLFVGFALQGALVGLAACALFALAPRLQKRYGSRWLCRLWLIVAALFLLPVRLVVPAVPAPVRLAVPPALTAPVERALTERAPAQAAVATPPPAPGFASPQAEGAADLAHPSAASPASVSSPPSAHIPSLSPLAWAARVWLIGAAGLCLWQFWASFLWLRHALRTGGPPSDGWQRAFGAAFAASGLARRPRFLCTRAVRGPLVAGLVRPVVFVPESEPPAQAAALMLTHELTHLKRRDLLFKALLLLVRAVHWYTPAAWLLVRLAGQDLEAACDEQAVAGRGPAYRAAYCDALLAAARMGRAPALSTCFALTKKSMAARFARLWDASPKRRGPAALAALALAAALAGGMVACSQGGAPAKLPAATPTPTPMPTPLPDRSGKEDVWPDLDVWNLSPVEGFPSNVPTYERDEYSALNGQQAGYATRTKNQPTVSLYFTSDGGKTVETLQCDLAPIVGQEPFRVSNYQMVSERTGFLVLRMGDAPRYETNTDVLVLRTRDGGKTWAKMGRHVCPQNAKNGLWHTQPFLWVNENVGFWVPHTRYDQPDVWRTLDGGAHWEQLDLSAFLPYIPFDSVPGVHTCSVRLDRLAPAPGHIVAKCYASSNNAGGNAFELASYDYGESWFLRDLYNPSVGLPFSAETEALYCGAAGFSLPEHPADQQVAETALALLRQANRLAQLPIDAARPSIYQWENAYYARILYPCAYLKTEQDYRAALAQVYTRDLLERYLKTNQLFSGASPHYVTHGGFLYCASQPYWAPDEFRDFSVDTLLDWYNNGQMAIDVEPLHNAFHLTLRVENTTRATMTLRPENGGWRIAALEVNPS
ncbi:M56 family metallopeptidase [Allofournierella sp.]|uniref:M56 family metallopeptidase n=1 Tax=Allofournierella sp. TaxID=1940256 RepID=UPI003AB7AB97